MGSPSRRRNVWLESHRRRFYELFGQAPHQPQRTEVPGPRAPARRLAGGLVATVSAQDPTEPQLESDSLCMAYSGCGGVIIQDELAFVQEAEDFERLAAQLLIDPVASTQTWYSLLNLHQQQQSSTEQLSHFYRSRHWQEHVPGSATTWDLDRLGWLELWRRHNPEQQDAWCRWAEEAAKTREQTTVIAELESALAADPGNGAVRSCLLRALRRAGSSARIQELLDADPEPDPEVAERYGYLPEALRSRFAFEMSSYDTEESLVEILDRARRQRPEDDFLEIKSLLHEVEIADDHRSAEILARLKELSAAELSVVERAVLCNAIDNLMEDPNFADSCWQTFSERIVEAGLHLSPSPTPDDVGKLDYGSWHFHVYEVRDGLVEKAVADRDLKTLERLLIEGPGFGYNDLWEMALDLTEVTDEEGDEAEELKALHDGLCARLGRAVGDGSLDRPVLHNLATCPKRAESVSTLLKDCGLDAEKAALTELLRSRISDLPDYSLGTIDAPVDTRIRELDRRLAAPEITSEARDLLERILTDLLIEESYADRLIELGKRLLARSGDLDQGMRKWLKKVREVPGVEVEILTDLLPIRPDDRLLRLRVAHERLRQSTPDLGGAARLAQEVLRSRRATVRERAEANYLLGRVAVLEGRLEDATPLLAAFYETRLDHDVCRVGLLGCDRDFPLHLIAIGDWPRLEAYLQLKAEKMAEQRELLREKGLDSDRFSAVALEKMRHRLLHDDKVLKWIFLDDPCGLPSALPHLEALVLERPDDAAIQERLTLERQRACVRAEGPFPWSEESQPMASFLAEREMELLLSQRYP